MTDASGIEELAAYLRSLHSLDIVVVDGSDEPLFAMLDAAAGHAITHVRPGPRVRGRNAKAQAVLTGLALASCEKVIVADDDVRYDPGSLASILAALDRFDVVRPQNFFAPAPWHAVYDGARSLINRAFDGDWPGTLAFRRAALPNGYDPDVLFENFELVQTINVTAAGSALPPACSCSASRRRRRTFGDNACVKPTTSLPGRFVWCSHSASFRSWRVLR